MTDSTYITPRTQYVPPPKVGKERKRMSRRTRSGMKDDAEYLATRDIYLEQNPWCAVCDGKATEIHHLCSGTAGKNASRLNQNTWLGLCETDHGLVEAMPFECQSALKVANVMRTIARLRT